MTINRSFPKMVLLALMLTLLFSQASAQDIEDHNRRSRKAAKLEELKKRQMEKMANMSKEEKRELLRKKIERDKALREAQSKARREARTGEKEPTEAEIAAAEAAKAAETTAREPEFIAKAGPGYVLKMRPYHQSVEAGQRFTTAISIDADQPGYFDRFVIRLRFPVSVKPVRIFDFPVANLVDPDFPPEQKIGKDFLEYSARLKNPREVLGAFPLIHVLWEARSENMNAELTLSLPGTPFSKNSALYLGEKNLLHSKILSNAAVVNGSVRILPEGGTDKRALQWMQQALKDSRQADLENPVRLSLQAPEKKPEPGEEFVMDVLLENPGQAAFDELSLAIAFDPDAVEVLDWDQMNWIRRGVNIYDAHAHLDFPFNIHTRNAVSNLRGRIVYQMGRSRLEPLPSGSVARIRCKAKTPRAAHSFQLFPGNSREDWQTDVRSGGISILEKPEPAQRVPKPRYTARQ